MTANGHPAARRVIAVAMAAFLAGCTTAGPGTSGQDTVTPTAPTPPSVTSTTEPPPTALTTPTVEVGFDEVDAASTFREPDDVVLIPWGTDPGQVGYARPSGPWAIDVAPDGAIAISDSANRRIQVFEGGTWRVVAQFADNGAFTPAGVAALDSGLVVVQGFPRVGTDSQVAFVFDRDGTLVDSGPVPVFMNAQWRGGEDAWASFGPASLPYYWLPLTDGREVTEFDPTALRELGQQVELVARAGANPPLPVDAMLAIGYDDQRDDGGVGLQVGGGQGWVATDDSPPFEAVVTRGDHVQRWRLSGTAASPIGWEVDERHLVTLSFFDPPDGGPQQWLVLDLRSDRSWRSFRIVRDQVLETNTWDFARIEDGRLYVLQTGADGARIEIYDLDAGDG